MTYTRTYLLLKRLGKQLLVKPHQGVQQLVDLKPALSLKRLQQREEAERKETERKKEAEQRAQAAAAAADADRRRREQERERQRELEKERERLAAKELQKQKAAQKRDSSADDSPKSRDRRSTGESSTRGSIDKRSKF